MAQALSVPRADWEGFFRRLGDSLVGKRAEVEVASLELGGQIVAEWLPLLGITYDGKNDLLDVGLQGMNHLIHHPREIVVDQDAGGLSSVAVVDAEERRQIIKLKDPVMLPPAVTT